jgi:dTDP-4-amino-4,6-dideoxygalactose transaminase
LTGRLAGRYDLGSMKVPLLDLKAQYRTLKPAIDEAIARVVESQGFILGPEVAALEAELAVYVGAAHAVGVSSGTDALLIALMALDIGPGDEVIGPPLSFFATAGVVARLGARPVFADVEPSGFNLDPAAVAKAITPRTKAIVPVHLFGRCARIDELVALGRQHGIPVVEDAAQSLGARRGGRQAGTFGVLGCYSFFPSKNLGAFGDGGMVVTSDDGLASKLRALRTHGAKKKYYNELVGGNFRLDALQAAVLRAKLPFLDCWHHARRRNAARYREYLASAPVVLPEDEAGHVYNQFVIRSAFRDELKAYLSQHGIDTEIYYPVPFHLMPCFAHLEHREGSFPHAEAAAREALALPIYPELTDEMLRYVALHVGQFQRARSDGAPAGSTGSP